MSAIGKQVQRGREGNRVIGTVVAELDREVPLEYLPKFVVASAGRSGSGTVARALTAAELPCGHEEVFNPYGVVDGLGFLGESSWLGVPALAAMAAAGRPVVHLVRHPLAVISSLVAMRFFTDTDHEPYAGFARKWATDVLPADDLTAACRFWVNWNAQIRTYATFQFKIEDVDLAWGALLSHLEGYGLVGSILKPHIDADYNRSDHGPRLSWDDLPSGEVHNVRLSAKRYGYAE